MNIPLPAEALNTFKALLRKAEQSAIAEPTAMALATANGSGQPYVRMVLLKDADPSGFVFYTNLRSRKGAHIFKNRRAALCFPWHAIGKQVLVEGTVVRVSDNEADEYWATRPRASQIGAWASLQSAALPSYKWLLRNAAVYRRKFKGRAVPRPPHWSGFRVVPQRIEFWTAKPFRLHERIEYKKTGNRWKFGRLYP